MENTLYLGLDVHKDSITIAIAGRKGEVRLYGAISNDLHAIEKALRKIRQAHGGARLEVCYEAGPCGFGIARRLAQWKEVIEAYRATAHRRGRTLPPARSLCRRSVPRAAPCKHPATASPLWPPPERCSAPVPPR